jgi:glycosyltransferase involved in cell wall biosynthesis
MIKTCIVIPVYNHEHAITNTLSKLQAFQMHCILVNDGSNENCTQTLRQLACTQKNITLIEHEHNLGKGGAVKTGLLKAYAMGYTHALQIDADGQHNSNDIPQFLQLAETHPQALISGAPIYDESVPKHRLYARYITHVWVWINTLSFDIKDSMCGFRIYPLAATCQLINRSNIPDRMAFDTEIMVRLYWQGCAILSIPTRVHYPENGISHFQGLRDNLIISRMHATLFFGMLARLPLLLFRKLKKTS